MKYIVSKQSGVHAGSCILGSGDTREAALVDAFGPRPWTQYQKKSARDACVRKVDEAEFEKLVWH